jgi:hypothetical protein
MRIAPGVLLVSALFVPVPVIAATCESLAALKLPSTTITAARSSRRGPSGRHPQCLPPT